jgi:metallophosphoesterase (TIGR00282 family)
MNDHLEGSMAQDLAGSETKDLIVLVVGDVLGRPGRIWLRRHLHTLRMLYGVSLVVANVENASGGFGITEDSYKELLDSGVDVMTSGNHHYDQKGDKSWMERADFLIHPLNFPPDSPGQTVVRLPGLMARPLTLLNLMGRTFMKPYDCPFRAVEPFLASDAEFLLIDVHAETSSEKQALAWLMAGRASAVWGTHTHVPTADARILRGFTGYQTDLGMTGAYESVIGMEIEPVIQSFRSLEKPRFKVAEGDVRLAGSMLTLDRNSGACKAIQPLFLQGWELAQGQDGR